MNIRSRFAVLLLLIALTWQALLVQGHVHPSQIQPGGLQVSSGITAKAASSSDLPATPTTCPLCEEQALSGNYVPVVPVTVVPPAPVASSYLPSRFPAAIETHSFHAWRSRAPPQSSSLT